MTFKSVLLLFILWGINSALRHGGLLRYQRHIKTFPSFISSLRLQITTALTSKYPYMVPGRELVSLLSVLHQLLAEQRRGERGVYVLRCLREVAQCQARYPERAQVYRTELGRLWVKVWGLAVRGVSSSPTESLSLDLLASIIQGGLINVDRDFWKLLSGSVCKPSK